MAANLHAELTAAPITTRPISRQAEHRFFLAVAILFPLITVIGFAPSYYLKPLVGGPPLPGLLVHVHGLAMSAWIGLFAMQVYLVSSKRLKLHMTLGMASVFLAAVMIVTGVLTGYGALARGSGFPGYPPSQFFIVPLGGMVNFAILFAAAIYLRKRPADHKRLMLVTVLNFIPPSISRLPFSFIPELGAIWFCGVVDIIAVALLAADTYRNGKLNRAFAAGVALLLVSIPAELAFAKTETWAQFTTWLIS